jgi:hypothetical protein
MPPGARDSSPEIADEGSSHNHTGSFGSGGWAWEAVPSRSKEEQAGEKPPALQSEGSAVLPGLSNVCIIPFLTPNQDGPFLVTEMSWITQPLPRGVLRALAPRLFSRNLGMALFIRHRQ